MFGPSSGIVIDISGIDAVEENRVLADHNLVLAIVVGQQKSLEQEATYRCRALEELLDREWLDNQHQRNVIHNLIARLANINAYLISELREYITFLEEAAEDASWTESSQRDEIRLLEGIVDSKNISSMEESIDWERSRNYMLCKENCHLSGEVSRLQAQINNLRASHPGMESKMEYPPSKESTSCAAFVGGTAGVLDGYSSDDNLSLFLVLATMGVIET